VTAFDDQSQLRGAHLQERIGNAGLWMLSLLTVLPILGIVIFIIYKGVPGISWEFLTSMPSNGMREGGILPAIIGTFLLTLGCFIFAVPLGIAAGIYMADYAGDTPMTRAIRIAIISLAGVPSVVYGLFGLGLFVVFFKMGVSILAAALTLAIMTLPVVISTTEESLRTVPNAFRVVSISLGATRWQTIRRIIMKEGMPGILTGVILGLERAAVETAPILFTGAAFYLPTLPTSPLDPTMALPYHIYVISTQVPGMPLTIQYATVLVMLSFVLIMNVVATIIRSRARAKRQW
jgi:phosphate transport system permease protein